VVVYTSRHDVSFGELSPIETARVVEMWVDRSRELWSDDRHEYVLIFENRGGEAGATLAHPHGQIYAFDHLPPRAAARARAHGAYRVEHAACLGCALVGEAPAREILANDSFAVAVPYAAHWPYEVAVRGRRHGLRRLTDLYPDEQIDLADALGAVARRLDLLFDCQTPYLMVAQEAPHEQPDWHLAFEFLPLLRSRGATKIRASVETVTGLFLNDVLPEEAATRLASLDVTD
jgi:UDPglucose--hexose-1-phosphate uridylyltransferase